MNASCAPGVRQLLATALALTLASSPAVAQSHFTAVRAQIDLNEVPNVVVISSQLDPSFAEVGSVPDIYAKARASYGNNGAFATATGKPTTLGAYAESIWADHFTVFGSTGTGTLDIRVVVNGSMDGGGVPGGPGSNSLYQLFVSSSPISCDFDAMSCTGTRLMFAEGIAGSRSFDAQISFTYGETFYVASYLGAEVLGDGFSWQGWLQSRSLVAGVPGVRGQADVSGRHRGRFARRHAAV